MGMKLSGCCVWYSLSVARVAPMTFEFWCCRRFGTISDEKRKTPCEIAQADMDGAHTHMRPRVCRKTKQIACAHVSSKEIVKGEHIYNNSPKWATAHECAHIPMHAERAKYSQLLIIINNNDLLNLSNFARVFHTLSRAIPFNYSHMAQNHCVSWVCVRGHKFRSDSVRMRIEHRKRCCADRR